MTVQTTNGSCTKHIGVDAAPILAKDIQAYQQSLQGGTEETRGLAAIDAGVAVINAFCGVAGLKNTSEPETMEIEIINNSPYPLIPYSVDSKAFGFQEAARLMMSGESSTLKGCTSSGFSTGESEIAINFLIGSTHDEVIQLRLNILMNKQDRWVIYQYTIDGETVVFDSMSDESLQYLVFKGKDASWPSFSVNTLPVRHPAGGTMHVVFYPASE